MDPLADSNYVTYKHTKHKNKETFHDYVQSPLNLNFRSFPYLQVGLVAGAGRVGGSSPWPGMILPLYLYYQS